MAPNEAVQALLRRHFPPETHPYRRLERTIAAMIREGDTVLEIGCGRTAPLLATLKGRARQLIGIDPVDFTVADPALRLLNNDVGAMTDIASGTVDLAYSRSVMEHIPDAPRAYAEIRRVLKSGGTYVFLTPNFWDYASLIAWMTPNAFHGRIVKAVEGRNEIDVFPTRYQTNTRRAIRRLAAAHGFAIDEFVYLGQYPNYLLFNSFLFRIGCWYAKFLERHQALHGLQGWILCRLRKT